MDIKHNANNIMLTSSEIAYLWAIYTLNSLAKYSFTYVIEKCKDDDIRSVFQFSLDLANTALEGVKSIFNSVKMPIPHGFNEKDVNMQGDNLFSDVLMLNLLKTSTSSGRTNYGNALPMAARLDVRQFITNCVTSTIELSNKIDEVELNKGIFLRTPYVQIPKSIGFAHDKSIFGSVIGHKRALNCMEIAHVFKISAINRVGEAHLAGISQVIKNNRVKDYITKGRKLLKKHAETLNIILDNEELTTPRTYETEVLNATISPLSDKVFLTWASVLLINIINDYEVGKINSMRKDIYLKFTQLSTEVVLYLKEGTDIMIENGWFEEQP